jgi:gamma-glutamyltranspeptidase / glutathione hydrolase
MNRLHLSCFLIFLAGCSVTPEKSFQTGKNIVADSGMVVSAHHCSSETGAFILKKGGNAVDAAVATEFALAVSYPEAGNIGGGGFMLIRMNGKPPVVIDYREKAPVSSSRDMYLDMKGNVVPGLSTNTRLSSGVPGTVDGMIRAHSLFGRLPFRDVIQPAIDLAEKGFPLTSRQAEDFNNVKEALIERNHHRTAFVKDAEWKEGDTLRQPELAATLKRIRDLGREGFYSGTTARYIISEMKNDNGIIHEEDLSGYSSVSRQPLISEYRGYKIITAPPPSGGGIVLIQLLKMIEPYTLKEMGFHSPDAVHLIAEAEKRAFADRSEFSGDPDYVAVPVEKLISQEYNKLRMADFNNLKATPSLDIKHGYPEPHTSEETTHYSVVDAEGNAVSATTTLNNTFGSCIVVDSAGFFLNDEMDDFSVKPGYPNMYGLIGGEANSIVPGKRMLSSMTPTIVEKNGMPVLVLGSPGGSTIPTTVFQVIINVLDYDMNISQAVDTGRFHHQWLPDQLYYEKNSMDNTLKEKLAAMGYDLKERSSIGSANAIQIIAKNRKSGAADKRNNNSSCGY